LYCFLGVDKLDLINYMKKIFNQLQGGWQFERVLRENVSLVSLGTAKGIANFKPHHNTLSYKEEGILINSDHALLKVHKEYLYYYLENQDLIEKHTAHNENSTGVMYTLKFDEAENFQSLYATGLHICKNDLYEAIYHFDTENFNKFKLVYRVKGPNKNYISETSYERIALN